jgi:type I restriction enzyme S subunit
LYGVKSGVAQGFVSLEMIKSLPLWYPPLPTQRKIAAILSAYDDLIENNTRRIKILEEMAQALYREWFVKFRFPGHDNVKMVESEFGMMPEGWEVKSIGEIGKVVLGGTPSRSRSEYWRDGSIPWINSGKLNDIRVIDSSELITEVGLNESATKLMPRKTVLVAITGAILLSMLEMEACANQSVVGIHDIKFVSQEYLHLYLCENISIFETKMSGSAQQHINKEIVARTDILIPSCEISDKFNEVIQPIYSMVAALLFRNVNLRSTRDLLLPRFISGEVDVEKIDVWMMNNGSEGA